MNEFQLYVCMVCFEERGFFCESERYLDDLAVEDCYCPCKDKTPNWVISVLNKNEECINE